MSSEQNMSEVPTHQVPPQPQPDDSLNGSGIPHGMGQSKSSRRRRRKRKPSPAEASGESQNGSAPGMLPAVQAAQATPSGASPSAPSHQGPSQNGAAQGASGKRWKKKFRDRDRTRSTDNPGNQASGSAGPAPGGARDTNTHQFGNRADAFKRKSGGSSSSGKQGRDRGPRSFVGPMDHSYRAVNGNFSEAPPSTIETHGSAPAGRSRSYHSGSDSQPIDYSQGRSIPVPDDAQTRIVFFIDDLFFTAKINETARKLGIKVAFRKNEKEVIAEMLALDETARPALIVFDLNNASAKPLTLVPKLKAKFKRSTSIVGFLSHLQGDLKAKATEAGCDTVMPRAAFSQNLPNLLRRYGLEEEAEESNFNQ